MTKKIINFILFIIIFLIPLAIFPPSKFPDDYNIPKIILLYFCSFILLICLLIKHKELKLDKSDKILLGFLALVGISTIFSVNVEKSLIGQSNRYEGLITFVCYYLIYYSGKYYFEFDKKFIIFSFIVIYITCTIGTMQYYNYGRLNSLLMSKYHGEYFSSVTFGNRNFFGSFITLCVPYAMCLYILYNKKLALFISAVAFYGLLVSLTRSAWVAFFVYAIIGIIYIIKQKDIQMLKRAGITLSIFIILFTIFINYSPTIFQEKYSGTMYTINNYKQSLSDNKSDNQKDTSEKNTSVNSESTSSSNTSTKASNSTPKEDARIVIWKSALRIIKDNPIIGCGTDAYLSELLVNNTEYLTQYLYSQLNAYPDKAHNEFLHIAATIGIPALIIYLTFLFITLKNLIKSNFKENKQSFILFLCLVGYLVQAFFNISTIGVAPIFYFLLGFSYQNKQKLQ